MTVMFNESDRVIDINVQAVKGLWDRLFFVGNKRLQYVRQMFLQSKVVVDPVMNKRIDIDWLMVKSFKYVK